MMTRERAQREAEQREATRNPPASDATLRDHYAGLAMQGLLAGTEWQFAPAGPLQIQVVTDMALASYQVADAMLKARQS